MVRFQYDFCHFIWPAVQELATSCLKELDIKKKQEVDNIRHIEQASVDLEVKQNLFI